MSSFHTDIISVPENRRKLLIIRNILWGVFLPFIPIAKVVIAFFKMKPEYTNIIFLNFMWVVITAIIFGGIIHFYCRWKRIIGKIEFNTDAITIIIKKNQISYSISSLENFTIVQDDLEGGKIQAGSMSLYDNWISFSYNGTEYKYQFRIRSLYAVTQFDNLINEWKHAGYLPQNMPAIPNEQFPQ